MAKVASGNGESFVVSLHFVHEPGRAGANGTGALRRRNEARKYLMRCIMRPEPSWRL
jgi:hypothetical protein